MYPRPNRGYAAPCPGEFGLSSRSGAASDLPPSRNRRHPRREVRSEKVNLPNGPGNLGAQLTPAPPRAVEQGSPRAVPRTARRSLAPPISGAVSRWPGNLAPPPATTPLASVGRVSSRAVPRTARASPQPVSGEVRVASEALFGRLSTSLGTRSKANFSHGPAVQDRHPALLLQRGR